MRPAKSLKIFSFLIIFFGLAGFSLPVFADTSFYYRCGPSSNYINVYISTKSANSACAAAYGVGAYSFVGDSAFCGVDSSSGVGNCNFRGEVSNPPEFLDPDHPFCLDNPQDPVCLPSEDPEDPLAPDSPYCLQNPYSYECAGEGPTENECAYGVGAESCCASVAAQFCGGISHVLSWNLSESLDTCTYSCNIDPPTPPEMPDFDETPPDKVDPTAPTTPEDPSDPENPLSNDLAKNTQSIDDLNRLIAESTNVLSNSIYIADQNNQEGFKGVIDTLNSNLGQGTPLAHNFGDGTLTAGDAVAIRSGLGLTGNDTGWSSLEDTVNITDYTADYDYIISSSGCPAPYEMQLFNSTFQLSYQPFCEIFEFVGYLVILAGVFLTPYIVFGFRGK